MYLLVSIMAIYLFQKYFKVNRTAVKKRKNYIKMAGRCRKGSMGDGG
jgi:hypothetical protein